MTNMQLFYKEKVVPVLMERFGYKNVMQIPRLEKIVINMGVGDAAQNRKILDDAVDTLSAIAGQKQSSLQPRMLFLTLSFVKV